MKQIILIATLALLLSACETTGHLTPLAGGGQKEMIRDGNQAVVSTKKNTVAVSAFPSEVTDGERGSILIVVSNHSKSSFLVSPANVQATTFVSSEKRLATSDKPSTTSETSTPVFETATDASSYLSSYKRVFPVGKELKVYSYAELVEEEKERAAMQAVAIALGGMGDAMAASNAGYQTGHGTINTFGTQYGSSFGTYQYTSYNYAAAQAARNAAQAKTSAKAAEATAVHDARMSELRGTILKEHTLLPGESYGGVVKLDLPPFANSPFSVPLVIEVDAGNEKHSFVFKLRKVESQ